MSKRGATPREDVYSTVDGERDYQKRLHGNDPTPVNSFILYMEHYLMRARTIASTCTDGNNSSTYAGDTGQSSLDSVRKVVALGVACMEQHGAPRRALSGCEHVSGPTRCSDCAYDS